MKKDVIYIDIDDEITTITDKVQSSTGDIIALVLPKRCPLLQSAVNMKILNKTANNSGKRVVLITSEASLLPVAGAAKVYVASTLQSKPEIPEPAVAEKIATINEADDLPDPEIDKSKPIGELALSTSVEGDDDDAPIELDTEEAVKPDKKLLKGEKKNRKLMVPNFEKFRLRLFIIILVVILAISGVVYAVIALPKATVVVTTQNRSVTANVGITASFTAKTVDVANKIVPAEVKTIDQSPTRTFVATGQKDIGAKATGKVTLTNCDPAGEAVTVPAGTTVTSNGLSFTTDKAVTLDWSTVPIGSHKCLNQTLGGFGSTFGSVNVTATSGGDKYNLSANRSYTVSVANVQAYDNDGMGGGTTSLVTAISQSDCDTAKNDLLNTNTDDYKNQLAAQLSTSGMLPLRDTFVSTPGTVTCAPAVGEQAAQSTATLPIKLSMAGLNISGLDQIVKANVSAQIQGTQSIFDTGVRNAVVTIQTKAPNGDLTLSLQSEAQTGIKQGPAAIARSIAGRKYGDSLNILKNMSGVSDVKISYSPFWVSGTPKDIKRVTVTFVNNGN